MRWFQPSEWRCRCGRASCDAPLELDPQWGDLLDNLRDRVAQPVILASGCRCVWWNREQGGKDDSRHLTGRAVDIRCTDPCDRWLLMAALLMRPSEEIPFVELAGHHIHWDLDFRNKERKPMLILGPG